MRVVMYTIGRPCPLCDVAWAQLERIRGRHAFDLERVVIDGDPRLVVRHALRVPVIEIDGREAFGRITGGPQAALRGMGPGCA
jgi:hypothetical protein